MSLEVMFYLSLVLLAPLAIRGCARTDSRRRRVGLPGRHRLAVGAARGVEQRGLPRRPRAVRQLARVLRTAGPLRRLRGRHDPRGARRRPGRPPGAARRVALVRTARRLGVVVASGPRSHPDSWGQVVFHDIAGVGWFLLLASTVLGAPGQTWSRLLSWSGLTWLGLISYSTYMWHEPIMLLLGASA